MTSEVHSTHSMFREALLEHIFVGEVLRKLWLGNQFDVEVLKPQVDAAGYDVVLVCKSITRHVQLKSTAKGGRRANVNVHLQLRKKPGGCVIWFYFDPETLKLGPFYWFGRKSGKPLPPIEKFPMAKHTKGDSTGKKAERPNLRLVPKGKFEKLASIDEVVVRLFG